MMEVLNYRNTGKMGQTVGNCEINSSKTEHMAKQRLEEKHGAPGTELHSYRPVAST